MTERLTMNDFESAFAHLEALHERLTFEPPLDDGIKYAVELLALAGIETYESCEGGEGHAYPKPTIRFHGDRSEGFRALALVLQHALPVEALKRVWVVNDSEPTGPDWEIVFWRKLPATSLAC